MSKEMTWLDKICYPLEHPKYPQIKQRLVEYDDNGEIIGKCARGEIACQNNISTDFWKTILTPEDFIKLGVPCDFAVSDYLPFLDTTPDFDLEINSSIGDYIICMNDTLDFTEPEIAEFLRTTFEDAV